MRKRLAALLLAMTTAGVCVPATTSAAASEEEAQAARRVRVSATVGWQNTGVWIERGDVYSVAYLGGRWTVDETNFPYVTAGGYGWGTDRRIYQGCKIRDDRTYGTLLGKVSGGAFTLGRYKKYRAGGSGWLRLRINDADRCLGDNDGSVLVSVRILRHAGDDADDADYGDHGDYGDY
ncbi:hypothetical protein HNP84_008318 [Thermocatellispora tengchongensis]|uniref:DUF1036 domain-containing protein n=1 Tax=Thermocatellispora tengchongensis TaxID=1073253 RepID=A0A840PAZ4_9ACTN|nr:hypothetical protein [Thermocatellispora tengchongensis]MBB5138564.1 hypothetical protein [Thermocatellispora tengchongensis]